MLSNPRVPKGLQENAAIALGRLGIHNAELLAPNLPSFADEFLNAMTDVDPSEEKSTAFKGFTAIVAQNPQSIESVLLDFFTAIAQYEDMDLHSPEKRELHEAFQNIINIYKQMIPQFADFLGQLQPHDQENLRANYSF